MDILSKLLSVILSYVSEVAELKIAKGLALPDILTELHTFSHRSKLKELWLYYWLIGYIIE